MSYKSAPVYMFGHQVPRNHEQAVKIDRANGNTKWQDSERIEKDQLLEYETFIDKEHRSAARIPEGYKRIISCDLHTVGRAEIDDRLSSVGAPATPLGDVFSADDIITDVHTFCPDVSVSADATPIDDIRNLLGTSIVDCVDERSGLVSRVCVIKGCIAAENITMNAIMKRMLLWGDILYDKCLANDDQVIGINTSYGFLRYGERENSVVIPTTYAVMMAVLALPMMTLLLIMPLLICI
jgi:hypothetical protein